MLTDRRNLNCLLMTEDRNSIDSRVSNCERRLVFFKQRSSAEITFFKVSIKRSLFQVSIKRRLFRVFDREKNFKRSAVGRHFKRIIKWEVICKIFYREKIFECSSIERMVFYRKKNKTWRAFYGEKIFKEVHKKVFYRGNIFERFYIERSPLSVLLQREEQNSRL